MTEGDILELCRAVEQYKDALELAECEISHLQGHISTLEESSRDYDHISDDRSRSNATPIKIEASTSCAYCTMICGELDSIAFPYN